MNKLTLQLISNLPKKSKEDIHYLGTLSKQDAIDLFNISNNIKTYKDNLCYIYGKTNTQKTTMITLLGYELIEKEESVKYITLYDLICVLCNFNLTEKQEGIKNDIYDCSFLIIDDFNGKYITSFKFTDPFITLYNFIKVRCNILLKNIIFISQYSLDDNDLLIDIKYFIKTRLEINRIKGIKTLFNFRDDYFKSIDSKFNLEEFYKIKGTNK